MAWTDFYIQSGGSDLNSGSTNANAAAYTSASGNWSTVTNQFTPTDGSTPASSVSVGDWVSIYTGAPSATSFVAQVTAVAAGVNGAITVSTTAKYGTAPTTASGTITLKDGGAHASFTPWANFGSGTINGSTRINVKQATYTLSASLTIALNGTETLPIWFRGYNTTVGDLDNGSTSLSYPTFTGNQAITMSGTCTVMSAFVISASASINPLTANANVQFYRHCQFTNTYSGPNASGACAAYAPMNAIVFSNCYFRFDGSAAPVVFCGGSSTFLGCTVTTGVTGGTGQTGIHANGGMVHKCTITAVGGDGITLNVNAEQLITHCTIKGVGRDGVRVTNTGWLTEITDCVFANCGGFDINNQQGGFSVQVYMENNLSYSPTSGHLGNFGDWPDFNTLTDTSSPFVSSTDLHLVSTSNGAGAGMPGQWEDLTSGLKSTPDVGAWQRAVPAAAVQSLILQPPSTY